VIEFLLGLVPLAIALQLIERALEPIQDLNRS
jgi:hypothetical protein